MEILKDFELRKCLPEEYRRFNRIADESEVLREGLRQGSVLLDQRRSS
jgi:hypothetical protein